MGVLTCDRKGCQNVMCDRHSYTYGHICNECFEELVARGVSTDIEKFMNTEKQDMPDDMGLTARQRFDGVFRDRDSY